MSISNQDTDIKPSSPEKFSDGRVLCLVSLFVLCNYFAVFALPHCDKALAANKNGDIKTAKAEAKRANAWSLWGLIPSTAINVAIIYFFIILMIKVFQQIKSLYGI